MDNIYYIRTIKGKYLYGKNNYKIKDENDFDLYNCSINSNLDICHFIESRGNKAIKAKELNGKIYLYTDIFINVKFSNKYRVIKRDDEGNKVVNNRKNAKKRYDKNENEITTYIHVNANGNKIRNDLYKNGFNINGKHYVQYSRTASKAKNNSCIFILEEYYKDMISFENMGKDFENKELEVCSIQAYRALTMSAIEKTITINPENILMVNDIIEEYPTDASVTRENDEVISTQDEKITLENKVTDGESLVDYSIFKQANREDKAVMQLRSSWFKSCTFNTNIQNFLKDYAYDHNIDFDSWELKDIFDNKIKAKDVLVITTPSSLKWLKMADKKDVEDQKRHYEYWKQFINHDNNFGIVRSETESKFGDKIQQLTYQVINSLDFTKDELRELLKYDFNFIQSIKDDIQAVARYVGVTENLCYSRQLIYNLIARNKDIEHTALYKNYVHELVNSYIDNLREGRIKISNTDYAILCGNPYELLLRSVSAYSKDKALLKGNECYCSMFDDEEYIAGFRSPLICGGNVLYMKNTYKSKFTYYFNFTDNVVIINGIDNDLMERGSGFDYDGDEMILSTHPTIVSKALDAQQWLTPVNKIEASTIIEPFTAENRAKIDGKIGVNYTGKIVNLSQVYQSLMWDTIHKKAKDIVAKDEEDWKRQYENIKNDKQIKDLYNIVSKLSSLSNVEIDSAKKNFTNIEMYSILDKLRKTLYSKYLDVKDFIKLEDYREKYPDDKEKNKGKAEKKYNEDLKKTVRPVFMKYCKNDNKNGSKENKKKNKFKSKKDDNKTTAYAQFKCSMDYLEQILDKEVPHKKKSVSTWSILDLMITAETKDKENRKQMDKLEEVAKSLDSTLRSIQVQIKEEKDKKERFKLHEQQTKTTDTILEELRKLKIKRESIIAIYKQLYSEKSKNKEISRYGLTLLTLLYKAAPKETISIFKENVLNFHDEEEKNAIKIK